MAHYETTIKATAKHTIYYRYRCEFCGRDTGWLSYTITETGAATGRSSSLNSKANLTKAAEKAALKKLNIILSVAKQSAAKSRKPALFLEKNCPACGKLQS